MFVQIIQGKVSDPSRVRAALQRWVDELAPGATGWLGSTTGVTDDGTLVAVARFATEEDARRNSDRPEQGRWWAEVERMFDGPPTFAESTEVEEWVPGDPDTAGFVQVMQGQTRDLERARALRQRRPDNLHELRPDLLGTLDVAHDEGRWTSVAYFTSEAEARQRESQEPPPEFRAVMEEMASLAVGDITYHDLRQVWLDSPRSAGQSAMTGARASS